jgi:hypothetical protein
VLQGETFCVGKWSVSASIAAVILDTTDICRLLSMPGRPRLLSTPGISTPSSFRILHDDSTATTAQQKHSNNDVSAK